MSKEVDEIINEALDVPNANYNYIEVDAPEPVETENDEINT